LFGYGRRETPLRNELGIREVEIPAVINIQILDLGFNDQKILASKLRIAVSF
jgi:hypothetical protein